MSGSTIKIGLTGGIGSGKTTVSNLFADLNIPVIDADVIARELLAPNTLVTTKVINEFGSNISSNGSDIDREKLRQLIFSNAQAKKKLESILHPLVRDEIQLQSKRINAPYCIIVIPLLFEAGHQDLVDKVLVVDTSPESQISRVTSRDNTNSNEVQKIIDAQISSAERIQRADNVIENNNGLETLKSKVLELDKKYRSL